jgi:hypothetical protein
MLETDHQEIFKMLVSDINIEIYSPTKITIIFFVIVSPFVNKQNQKNLPSTLTL